MTQLDELFPLADLDAALKEGYVRSQRHPQDARLVIFNYTEKAQFDRVWTPVTNACRGLIVNSDTLEVLARPFPKFHNWDESGQPYPPPGPIVIADKMDGSLGIMYSPSGNFGDLAIATRGSFSSYQAIKATEILHRNERGKSDLWLFANTPEKTYLFEIIYPENRIVVNYGNDEKLVLLDVIDTATGLPDMDEFDAYVWSHKVNRRLEGAGFNPMLLEDETLEGDEGIVLLWPGTGYRVKMKRADYIELHRIVTGLDERKVWQALMNHVDISKFCEPLPDEFHQWVKDVATRILTERNKIMKEATIAWAEATSSFLRGYTRKDLAIRIAKHPLKSYMFSLEDGKDISDAVLKTLQPEGNQYAKSISDDVA